MSGFDFEITTQGLEALNRRIWRLADGAENPIRLMRALAAEGESQTRRRIESDKRAPDGAAWQEWSQGYAITRHSGQSLLDSTGALVSSITAFADRETAGWGTNLVYAPTHQFGRGAIPPRPFLGVSLDDAEAFLDIAEEWADDLLRAGQ